MTMLALLFAVIVVLAAALGAVALWAPRRLVANVLAHALCASLLPVGPAA